MNAYEMMLVEYSDELIVDDASVLPSSVKGFYAAEDKGNIVLLNKDLKTVNERVCILAEEVGHHFTTVGDITDLSKTVNRKQEEKARRWAVRRIASLKDIISAFEAGCRTKEELTDHLNITEEFLLWSIDYYKKKYELMTVVDKQYIVCFEPFGIVKLFKEVD
ncbi:MAG TPA: ImmA/IrrE family metallo-endopeptidase [Clostridia bacterium]|nr:ImmA/IrrE family metallo-endopeptidase [Clostridia bacterium]